MDPCEEASADFELPLQIFAYFLATVQATYVSAPITSGWRFLAWYKEKGRGLKDQSAYKDAHALEVIAANCQHVSDTVVRLKRLEHPKPVLDPTSFNFPGWSQADYHCFWGKVIQRFVDRAIFLDGWEASVGCVYEFCVALRSGIPTLDERDQPISPAEALGRVRRSASVMAELGLERACSRRRSNILDR
jgi:hypothetical protein